MLHDPTRRSSSSAAAPRTVRVPPVVRYAAWEAACHRAAGAVLTGSRRVVVSGPAGCGKSLLLREVARILRAAGWSVGCEAEAVEAQVLLVDHADTLSPQALRWLLRARGAVVLAGSERLARRVRRAVWIGLPALGRDEAREYVAGWLALVERTPERLESAGMRLVFELSGGVPRAMSALLGAACWLAESEGSAVIRREHVTVAGAVAGAVRGGGAGGRAAARRWGVVAAAAMVCAGAGFVVARWHPVETTQAVRQAEIGLLRARAAMRGALGLEPEVRHRTRE